MPTVKGCHRKGEGHVGGGTIVMEVVTETLLTNPPRLHPATKRRQTTDSRPADMVKQWVTDGNVAVTGHRSQKVAFSRIKDYEQAHLSHTSKERNRLQLR